MSRVEIYHSRRVMFRICEFWLRDESPIYDRNEFVHQNKPSGRFYARQINAESKDANNINGVMLLDKNVITLESNDDLDDLTRGSLVKYNDELWLVEGVQKEPHLKESQFSKEMHYTYYISLRS